jgi:hypothetical protein
VPRDGLAGVVGVGVIINESDPLDPDGRWAGPQGYTLEAEPCDDITYYRTLDFCAEPPLEDSQPPGSYLTVVEDQKPFLVGAGVTCSTFGTQLDDVLASYRAVTDRGLELRQWSQIANELWTGDRANNENRYLADANSTDVGDGDAVSLVEAIGLLEDAFGNCSPGGVQVIHMPRKLVAYASWKKLIWTTPGSGRIYTANDSLVVADRGYPGTGPEGVEPTETTAWIYSTGVLTARLGPVRHPELDWGYAVTALTNDVAVRSERAAAINWACCHLAVNVEYGV